MQRISDETRKRVVREHIQDGRTIASLAAEYGVSRATVLIRCVRIVKNALPMTKKKHNWNLWMKSVNYAWKNWNSKRKNFS